MPGVLRLDWYFDIIAKEASFDDIAAHYADLNAPAEREAAIKKEKKKIDQKYKKKMENEQRKRNQEAEAEAIRMAYESIKDIDVWEKAFSLYN